MLEEGLMLEILYFLRRGCSGVAATLLSPQSNKANLGKSALLFQALMYLRSDKCEDAVRLLYSIKDDKDLGLASLICLSHAYKISPTNQAKAEEFDAEVKNVRRTANSMALYYAGASLFALQRFEKAKEFAEKSMKQGSLIVKYAFVYIIHRLNILLDLLHAIVQIETFKERLSTSLEMNQGNRHRNDGVEKLFGLAICAEVTGDLPESLRLLNQIIMRFPNFLPAFAEKVDVLLLSDQWERALEAASRSIQLIAASLNLATEHTKEALNNYKKAMKIDESSIESMNGLIHCQLLQGDIKDAALQLELLDELLPTIGVSAETVYLQALLLCKQKGKDCEIMRLLDKATDLHFKRLKDLPHSMDYYIQLNPDFLLQLVNAYLTLSQQPLLIMSDGKFLASEENGLLSLWPDEQMLLNRVERLLLQILEIAPGIQKATYLLARVHLHRGNLQSALKFSQAAVDVDPTCIDAHALQATIYLSQGNLRMAEQALEIGLSNNFDLRNHPLNNLVRAAVCLKGGETEKAIKVLSETLANPDAPGRSAKPLSKLNYSEFWITIYAELIYAYRKMGKMRDARRVLAEARQIYANTLETDRLAIIAADMDLAEGNLEAALVQLRTITSDRPGYILAKQRMADVYLNHRKEWKLYIACYRELADTLDMCVFAHLLLGDAYLRVEQPERAIEVYESVLRWEPGDLRVASKMGEALVMTHEFERAVLYYESALQRGAPIGHSPLLPDLTLLLVRLKQLDKAQEILTAGLESIKTFTDIPDLQRSTDLLILLGTVHQLQEDYSRQLAAFGQASKVIGDIQKHITAEESSDIMIACRKLLVSVQIHTADTLLRMHKRSQSIVETNSKGPGREASTKLTQSGEEDDLVTASDLTRLTRGSSGSSKELEKAIATCEEAMRGVGMIHSPNITDRLKQAAVMSLLARCHLANRDRAQCEQVCLKLAVCQEEIQAINEDITFADFNVPVELFYPMVADKNASEMSRSNTFPLRRCAAVFNFVPTAIIMADLLTLECDFTGVIPHLLKHLNEVPNDYRAMTHLISTYRRLGQLSTAEEYLHRVLEAQPSAKSDPGFNFVRGFNYWYRGDTNLAIRSFNVARLAREYEVDALCAMVECCLSLALYRIFPSFASSTTACLDSDIRSVRLPTTVNTTANAMEAGDETPTIRFSDAITVGQPGADMDAEDVESAGYETAGLLLVYESVPAIYGAAVCYLLLGQDQKAKNQLKRLAKYAWTPEVGGLLPSYPMASGLLKYINGWISVYENSSPNYFPLISNPPPGDNYRLNEPHGCDANLSLQPPVVWCLRNAGYAVVVDRATYKWGLADRLSMCNAFAPMVPKQQSSVVKVACLCNCSRRFIDSCYRACEFMGVIAEKNNSYEDAATYYNTAWEILNKQDLAIGYKLALNYLKAKDYFRTVDVCHEVGVRTQHCTKLWAYTEDHSSEGSRCYAHMTPTDIRRSCNIS
ncbi:Tetratricopeptide repeat protein [Echinococcus granulosus]|uniref:Tetratricopeptide repeat protein n=1 Tax=Echinococcus granulosus TaxID=6210 RepID=W6UWT6_ECHGR|nr:Tetratricopeptide repeat protein [Echinococcus granulosus]EUB62957.1 Tetratricopeptide repeat protein [Echinococcus granulosus]